MFLLLVRWLKVTSLWSSQRGTLVEFRPSSEFDEVASVLHERFRHVVGLVSLGVTQVVAVILLSRWFDSQGFVKGLRPRVFLTWDQFFFSSIVLSLILVDFTRYFVGSVVNSTYTGSCSSAFLLMSVFEELCFSFDVITLSFGSSQYYLYVLTDPFNRIFVEFVYYHLCHLWCLPLVFGLEQSRNKRPLVNTLLGFGLMILG